MHAYIHINKHNKNQKEKKLGVACSAVPTMNEKDETCSVLYSTLTYSANCAPGYAIPGTTGDPIQPTRLLSIQYGYHTRCGAKFQ
jgi:hypothetical protein